MLMAGIGLLPPPLSYLAVTFSVIDFINKMKGIFQINSKKQNKQESEVDMENKTKTTINRVRHMRRW